MQEGARLVEQLSKMNLGVFWLDVASDVLVVAAFVGFLVAAHLLAHRGVRGGISMLICTYLALIIALAPFLVMSIASLPTDYTTVFKVFSKTSSALFLFLAVINLVKISVYRSF